jgi:hypothetical protein
MAELLWTLVAAVVLAAVGTLWASRSAAAAECPNEASRSENGSLELPDCRAYERVTPEAKNGAEFYSPFRIWVGDGPRLAGETFANFGGVEFGSTFGTAYEFNRSRSGWWTTPLVPSAATFGGTNFEVPLFALGEGNRTLLGLRGPGQPKDAERLFLREGTNVTEVGPEAPPASWFEPPSTQTGDNTFGYFFGERFATPDLSHILYQLFTPEEHDYLWPFDQTSAGGGALSTYEYVGAGNSAPFLVGVRGGQGSTDLISGCGTYVGSAFDGDIYNAMSRSGQTVFFTPMGSDQTSCASPAGQPSFTGLEARIEGEGAAARTVSISEPSEEDCSACQTGSPSDATFQGASEDGARAFFLTEQELLPGNPAKNLYEYDFDGRTGEKVTAVSHLAGGTPSNVLGVVRVAENGSEVYFVATAPMTSVPNSTGNTAEAGKPNLYAYNTSSGAVSFVVTLGESDAALWNERDEGRPAEATPDGRYLLFASSAALTPDDTSSVSQLFRYDATTGQLIRVSTGQNGFGEDGNTATNAVTIPASFVHFAGYQSGPPQKMISDDGSRIFFESTGALTPKALDHVRLPGKGGFSAENIYEWHEGQVALLTDGRDRTHIGIQQAGEQRSSVLLLGTDSDGRDVFFTTTSPLISEDQDEVQDIYDASVDGGFPQAATSRCTGEGCQGPAAVAPPSEVGGSSRLVGPENPKPKKKPKHKRHHHKRHHHKRHRKRQNTDAASGSGRHQRPGHRASGGAHR